MNEEWLSAHLDGELSPDEERELAAALADDPGLARLLAELTAVRTTLRTDAVEIPADALPRVVHAVASASAVGGGREGSAPVVALADRRRVPTFAAAAAVMVVIASVVGGLGGSTTVPALGVLLARHEVAAAVVDGVPMPADMDDIDLDGMEPMPMEAAAGAALPMPDDFAMEQAYVEADTVHLVYRTGLGEPVSVFRQEGDVDIEALGDGTMARGDQAAMWSAPMDGAYVAVVDGDGYLWVIVSATPHDEMMDDMMHDLPSRERGIGERLRDAADAVVEPFRIWG